MNRKLIYTCITDGYDLLKEPTIINSDWDYVCFHSGAIKLQQQNTVWQLVNIDGLTTDVNVRSQRKLKIFNEKIFKEYDLSIWVDGSITINTDLNLFVKYYHNDVFSLMQHPIRNCIYKEADAVLHYKKDTPEIVSKQIDRYFQESYPANNGMVQTGVMVRTHTSEVIDFCNEWWCEVKKGSHRDQLSFNYVLHHTPIEVNLFSSNILRCEFILSSHLKK